MKRLTGLTLLLLLLALPAVGTQCETFSNHSGFVPDGWTATFIEDGIEYGPYEGPTFVDPGLAHEGNRAWDRAVKCRTLEEESTTTTTQPSTSTSSTSPTTTTTLPPTTTVTLPPESSTTTTPASTSTTNPAPTSTVPTPSTTGPSNPDQAVLPFTGVEDVWPLAALLLLTGAVILSSTRREDG